MSKLVLVTGSGIVDGGSDSGSDMDSSDSSAICDLGQVILPLSRSLIPSSGK